MMPTSFDEFIRKGFASTRFLQGQLNGLRARSKYLRQNSPTETNCSEVPSCLFNNLAVSMTICQ